MYIIVSKKPRKTNRGKTKRYRQRDPHTGWDHLDEVVDHGARAAERWHERLQGDATRPMS